MSIFGEKQEFEILNDNVLFQDCVTLTGKVKRFQNTTNNLNSTLKKELNDRI